MDREKAEQALEVHRQLVAVERAAREAVVAELASQREAWAAEQATLLKDKETTQNQAMDATLLLKEAIEVNTQREEDLHIRT